LNNIKEINKLIREDKPKCEESSIKEDYKEQMEYIYYQLK